MQQPNNHFQRPWQPMPPQWQAPPPKRRRRRRRFRWELFVGLPLILAAMAWVYNSVEVNCTWEGSLRRWGIVHKERFTALAILGVVACCVCAIVRLLRGNKGEE